MKTLTLIGRKWFQKSAGNTYHSVSIVLDGIEVWASGRCYGYGDQYQQTAMEWLAENGYPELGERHENGCLKNAPLSLYCRNNEINFSAQAINVARERDL